MKNSETYAGLPVYPLADVLSCLDLPLPYSIEKLSPRWRCVVAPALDAPRARDSNDRVEDEDIVPLVLEAGLPVRLDSRRAQRVYAPCKGDGIRFVTETAEWSTFSRPQIAVRNGWGSAGTAIETSAYYKMIGAFRDVLEHRPAVKLPLTEEERNELAAAKAREEKELEEALKQEEAYRLAPTSSSVLDRVKTVTASPDASTVDNKAVTVGGESPKPGVADTDAPAGESDVLELQYFHRDSADAPCGLPALGSALVWPSVLNNDDAAVCDVATCVSQQSAERHFHLNDCGEFVLQAALPQSETSADDALSASPNGNAAASAVGPHGTDLKKVRAALCEGNKRPHKLFLFAPRESYDFLIHDDEAIATGNCVLMDILSTPEELLPTNAASFPVLVVAVLHCGGRPLLCPPNVLTYTLTLNDGVLVEQRRLSNLWLDELSYFLHRCSRWVSNPIIYSYVENELQSEDYLAGFLIPHLLRVFREHPAATSFDAAIRRRAASSLLAIAMNEKHYQLSTSARQSLLSVVNGGDEEVTRELNASAGPLLLADRTRKGTAAAPSSGTRLSLREALVQYWSTLTTYWPKPGCVLRVPPLGTTLTCCCGDETEWFVPVVYARCRPVYGVEKRTLSETLHMYLDMHEFKGAEQRLRVYLQSRKAAQDDVLSSLF